LAEVTMVDDDVVALPEPGLLATVQALQQVIASLRAQGTLPFAEPFRLDDAGWVANRWCEILPISLAAKQKLMVLPDPQARLRLVHEYLRGKGVVN
jgi:Lon protease-like protein